MAQTRATLDKMQCCTDPLHDHSVLYLVQRCHEQAGLEARYEKATGFLVLTCKACESTVGTIQVAKR